MTVECAEVEPADAIGRTDVSINADGTMSHIGGDGHLEKVIVLGTEESSGNFSGDKGVFNDGASDVIARGRLKSNPFSEVGTAIRGDEESIFFREFVFVSAISAAGFGAVGGAQRMRVGARVSRSGWWCVSGLLVSQMLNADKYCWNVMGGGMVGRRGIGRIIVTFFQMMLVGWTSSSETQKGGTNKSGNVKHVFGEFDLG